MVIDQGVDLLLQVLRVLDCHLFLFAEFLVRVLAHPDRFPLRHFTAPLFLASLFATAIKLQRLNTTVSNEVIIKARTAILTFEAALIGSPETSLAVLTAPIFSVGFLQFVFEIGMSQTIILLLRNALANLKISDVKLVNIDPIISFIQRLFEACSGHAGDANFQTIGFSMASALVTALMHNHQLSHYFSCFLEPIVALLEVFPSPALLNRVLFFLTLIASSVKHYILSGPLLASLSKVVTAIDKAAPSPNTLLSLLGLLGGSISCNPGTKFLIAIPSVLPLILAVFGCSPQKIRILTLLTDLCAFSDYNKEMCHDGDLDFILLKYICAKSETASVSYRHTEITLSFSKAELDLVVWPLLVTISSWKSSNAIANLIADQIARQPDADLAIATGRLLSRCQGVPSPLFAMGSIPPQFSVKGITGCDLGSGFTIHFMLKPDSELVNQSNLNLAIVTIKDSQADTLCFFLNRGTLYVRYENGTLRTTVYFMKNVPVGVWTHITTSMFAKDGHARFATFRNLDSLNDSDLCAVVFPPEELRVEIGGCLDATISDEWNNRQVAVIGAFQLFPFVFTRRDVETVVKTPWNIVNRALFVSERVLVPARREVIPYYLGQDADIEMLVLVNDSFASASSLIDVLAAGNDCNTLALFFERIAEGPPGYASMVLDILVHLFTRSVHPQQKFAHVPLICASLLDNPTVLTYELYRSLFDVFNAITWPQLRNQWFHQLLVNLWLWSKAHSSVLLAIIHHWSRVLVPVSRAILNGFSIFSTLLNQYLLFFTLNPDGTPEVEFSKKENLNESYTPEIIRKCGDAFLTFLAQVAHVYVAESDLGPLVTHIIDWQNKETLLNLLDLVYNISTEIVKIAEFMAGNLGEFHHFLSNPDVDIVAKTLIVLQQLSGEKCHIHMMAAAWQFTKHPHQKEIFERMLSHLIDFPNVLPLLCLLALRLGESQITALSEALFRISRDELTETIAKISTDPMWFLWPLILAFYAKDRTEKYSVCDFIAYVALLHTAKTKVLLARAVTLIVYFMTMTKLPQQDILLLLLSSVNSHLPILRPELAEVLTGHFFCCIFFRISGNPFHTNLLREFEQSPFADGEDHQRHSSPPRLDRLDDLPYIEIFLGLPPEPELFFTLTLSDAGEWIDQTLAPPVLSICAQALLETDVYLYRMISALLQYFTAPRTGPKEPTEDPMAEAENVLGDYQAKFQGRFRELLQATFRDLTADFAEMRKVLGVEPDVPCGASRCLLQAEVASGADRFEIGGRAETVWERDPTICVAFAPFKMRKAFAGFKSSDQVSGLGESLFEKPAVLVNLDGSIPIRFRLYAEHFVLQSAVRVRVLANSQVRDIFARKKKSSAIEIYLDTGRSYLIDFQNLDVSSIVRPLRKATFVNCRSWPVADAAAQQKFDEKWLDGEISNFEYILHLNLRAGRSFKDPSEYPFFPGLLTDFDNLDSFDPASFATADPSNVDHAARIRSAFSRAIVAADFFFRSESIDELPKWAIDHFTFLNGLRRLLESPQVTAHLHVWVNTYFSRFVKDRRPRRPSANSPCSVHQFEIQLDNKTILKSIETAPGKLLLLTSDGFFSQLQLVFVPDLKCSISKSTDSVSLTPDTAVSSSSNAIAVFSADANSAAIIRADMKITTCTVFTHLQFVATACDLLFFCPDGFSIAFVSQSAQTRTLCQTLSRIARIAADTEFKLLICSTIDGNLLIYSIPDGRFVTSVNLGGEARLLMVTPKWGFLLALSVDLLSVLNVNGLVIKQCVLSERIAAWFPFSSASGFDCVAFQSVTGCIGWFPAFEPQNISRFHEQKEPVANIVFDRSTCSFVLVGQSGQIKVLPHPPIP
jgi:hypothetical protein